jgi:RHS repeat-associated protein/uncharacterized repeat protein (TIGR01451 family)
VDIPIGSRDRVRLWVVQAINCIANFNTYTRGVSMRSPCSLFLLLLSLCPFLLAPSCGELPLVTISAEPEVIPPGGTSTLTWDSYDADHLEIDNGIGEVGPSGSLTIAPGETTTYTITATNRKGSSTAQAGVTVTPLVAASLHVEPSSILAGTDATLSWTTENADSAIIDNGIGPVAANGSMAVSPLETTVYTLTASGPAGTVMAVATLHVRHPEPEVTLAAAPLSILHGGEAVLSWQSLNADSASLDQGIGPVPVTGSLTIHPEETTTYTITVTGPGGTASASVMVTVAYPHPTVSISADPATIRSGEPATLSWQSSHALHVVIDQGIGPVNPTGSIIVHPSETTTFTIMATGLNATVTDTATVTVIHPEPSAALSLTPEEIPPGGFSTLSWHTEHAHSISIAPDIGSVQALGSMTVSPERSTTYTLTATGHGGTASASAALIVTTPEPFVSLSASPATLRKGQSSTLSWQSFNGSSASIDPDVGEVPLNGSISVSPEITTTYTITVTGAGGKAADSATVVVTADVDPQPDGSFGEQYQDIIPSDATADFDPGRFVVLTGVVHDENGQPLEGARVSIHGNPAYGSTWTDLEGRFSLPAEGGAVHTVQYEKEGYITSHRQVQTGWNSIEVVDTPVMITRDPLSSEIVFDGNPATVLSHTSSAVADEWGTRSLTMVFTGDTRAYELDAQGRVVRELERITARATEFATQDSMPAVLPPNVAYTYCVEMEADGIERIRFNKPVVSFVDNFLGFEVGSAVPVGSYDRDRGVWVPEKNGVVVRLLDLNGDGRVDALDATGDGLPDDLNGDGQFSDEVRGLDPGNFSPHQTLWRFEAGHFTPWDCNWPFGPPADATPPNPVGEPEVDQQGGESRDCRTQTSSYVRDVSRTFHKTIPVPGTDLSLHYASNRVQGHQTKISVPASGTTVPSSLKSILVRVALAGRTLETVLPPWPEQTADFSWDGTDHLGRPVRGSVVAKVSIGFVYDAVYYSPGEFAQAFGQPGSELTSVQARQEVIYWKRFERDVRGPSHEWAMGKGLLADGWSLTNHHSFSPTSPGILHKGDGTVVFDKSKIIAIVAGTGVRGDSGDGGPALLAQLNQPTGLHVDAAGNLYIADMSGSKVRKVDRNGTITTIAGDGTRGFDGDSGPAIGSKLNRPRGVAVDRAGNIYIADTQNNRIRKVDLNGIITTIAGSSAGYSGDGGPAVQAQLYLPYGVALDASGTIYIADTHNNRVRKIDPNGIITTVAGSSSYALGDGGPATKARLSIPSHVAVDAEGNLFIADLQNNRVRKVDANGIITTVVGGVFGYNGDGIPAESARIHDPVNVAVDGAGNLYFSDYYNHRVRKVDGNGIISTVVGNGIQGVSGNGGPATEAQISYPYGLALDPSGNLSISENFSPTVRKVAPPFLFQSALAAGEIPFAEDNGLVHIVSGSGLHVRTIDLATGVPLRTFEYDSARALVSATDQFGNMTTILRDGGGAPYAIVSPDGLTTMLAVDGENRLIRITFPDGGEYDFEYTAGGLMNALTTPNGRRFVHEFDAGGRVSEVFDPEGGHWSFRRSETATGEVVVQKISGEGDVTTYRTHSFSGVRTGDVTSPSGGVSVYTDLGNGMTETMALSCGTDLTLSYGLDSEYTFPFLRGKTEKTPSGLSRTTLRNRTYRDMDGDMVPDLVTETVSINGKTTTFSTNTQLSRRRVTLPSGRHTSLFFDPVTLAVNRMTIPGMADVTLDHDSQGRLTAIAQGNRVTSFSYDSRGFLESVTDPESRTVRYDHDLNGRVTGILRPDSGKIGFTYDSNGNMTVLTSPAAVPHGFAYNGVDRTTAYHAPLSGSYLLAYDRDRRLTELRLPSGRKISNFYESGRLTRTRTPEGDVEYGYLCETTLGSLSKGAESIVYGYDGPLLTSETRSGALYAHLGYVYDNDFNLSSFTYAGASEIHTYDLDGMLTRSGDYVITRNAGNGLPQGVAGNGLSIARAFDQYGELSGQSTSRGGVLGSWTVTRDNAGRITSKTESAGDQTFTYAYTYDDAGRLLSTTRDGALLEEYAYSSNGSRIYERNMLRGIAGRFLSYSDEDHLLAAGEIAYGYDLDGFLTAKANGTEATAFRYSSLGELLRVDLPDGRIVEYAHDPLSRRIAKKVNGAVTEKYLWAGMARLLAVYDGSDNLVMRFEYADDRMPVAAVIGGSRYFLAYDQVGSLRVVSDSSGYVVKQVEYDTFGNIISDSNPAFEIPFGFAGGLHDRDINLVRFGSRDYDPETGRWTAKDPIGFAGGDTDLYGYCLNDPVNWIDPYGHKMIDFLSKIATRIAVKPYVEKHISNPSGQRIIIGGISGAVGGFVAGTTGGAAFGAAATGPLAGAGAIPGALIGGISGTAVGLSSGLLTSTIVEVFQLHDHIESVLDVICPKPL